jgi:hypothetical protein
MRARPGSPTSYFDLLAGRVTSLWWVGIDPSLNRAFVETTIQRQNSFRESFQDTTNTSSCEQLTWGRSAEAAEGRDISDYVASEQLVMEWQNRLKGS